MSETEIKTKLPTEGELKGDFKKVIDGITKYGIPIATFLIGYVAGDIFGISGMIYNFVGKPIIANTATANQAIVTSRMQLSSLMFTGIIYGIIGLFAWGKLGMVGNAIAGFCLGIAILYLINAFKNIKSIQSLTT